MSSYEDGYADGYGMAKEDILLWADTYEDADNYLLFYQKLIELLEQ